MINLALKPLRCKQYPGTSGLLLQKMENASYDDYSIEVKVKANRKFNRFLSYP